MPDTSRMLALLAWGALLPLAGAAAAHLLVAGEPLPIFVALHAGIGWLLLPAWAILALAASNRDRAQGVVAGVVCLAHLAWVLPGNVDRGAVPGGPGFTLVTANALHDNPTPDRLVAELAALDPDLLLLQEFSTRIQEALARAGLFDRYPHVLRQVREDAFGIALLSKLPAETELVRLERVAAIRATVRVGDREVRVWNVHTLPPVNAENLETWHAQLESLRVAFAADPLPVVAAGDFNLSRHLPSFSLLASGRMRDAAIDRGRARAGTWPNGTPLPKLALDHVFVSGELGVVEISEGSGPGSDHRPVIARLGLR